MAREIIARGQISIIDLNDAKSLNMYLRSNQPTTQIYNNDNKSFVPDWSVNNVTITPELFVSGTVNDQMHQVLTKPQFVVNGSTDLEQFGITVADEAPYTLTISKNMESVKQMRIQCNAVYTDPNIDGFETTIKAEIQFVKTENAGATICAIGYTPRGNVFKNDQTSTLIAHCDMWRGSVVDNTDVSFQWFKMNNQGEWQAISQDVDTFGCVGWDTEELVIPASAVVNFDIFKCEITDNDPGSNTYNTVVSDVIEFFDQSDPYYVEVYSVTGNKLVNGQGSTTLTAKVWRDGECLSDEVVQSKFIIEWHKKDAFGVRDMTWGDNGVKRGLSITVDASEINNKATFVCNLCNPDK